MSNQLSVKIVTRNLSNLDEPPLEKVINFASDSDRKWLERKHFVWAFNNNRTVTLFRA